MKIILLVVSTLCLASLSSGFWKPPFCTDDYWQNCLGVNSDCWPCNDRVCSIKPCIQGEYRNTVEKAVTRRLNEIIVNRNYPEAGPLFAPDAIVRVPPFDIFLQGREKIVLYLFLGDPAVSDQYEILEGDYTASIQELNVVFNELMQLFRSVRSPTGNNFNVYSSWKFTFNDLNQITEWVVGVDGLAITANLGGQLDVDPVSLCQTIQSACVGDNQQFIDQEDCVNFMNTIDVHPANPAQLFLGNTVTCRSFHSVLVAPEDPLARVIHCPHTGSLGTGWSGAEANIPPEMINPINTPCLDWFSMFEAEKRDTSSVSPGKLLENTLSWWCDHGEEESSMLSQTNENTRYCFTLAEAGVELTE